MAGSVSPSFPKGLRVLLVDEQPSKSVIEAQLQQPELQYAVTSVATSAEALSYQRSGVAAFDVVLAESRIVAADEAVGRAFVDAFEETPVVFMSEGGTTDDVMRAVQLGAVDFLDKPLSLLKLKNIWQHSVRKMMLKAAGPQAERCGCVSNAPQAPPSSSWGLASLAPESPGTPSASVDLAEAFSVGSMSEASAACSLRASMDCSGGSGSSESFMEAMNSAIQAQPAAGAMAAVAAPLSRPTSFGSLPAGTTSSGSGAAAAGGMSVAGAGGAAAGSWPALHPGCVWGTPVNGPVPPPLPSAAPAAAPAAATTNAWGTGHLLTPAPSCEPPAPLIKSCSTGILPIPASSDDLMIPEGFLSDAGSGLFSKTGTGPLGLKLKKSPSLLDLINSALSSDNLTGLCPMQF